MAQKHAHLASHGMQPYKSNAGTGEFWNLPHFNTESDFVFVSIQYTVITIYKMHIIMFEGERTIQLETKKKFKLGPT